MSTFGHDLAAARTKRGYSQVQTAKIGNMTISSYDDLENSNDEWSTVTPLYDVRTLCALLDLDLLHYVPASSGKKIASFRPPNDLIREAREDLHWSRETLSDKLGHKAVFVSIIEEHSAGLLLFPLEVCGEICDVLQLDLRSFLEKSILTIR